MTGYQFPLLHRLSKGCLEEIVFTYSKMNGREFKPFNETYTIITFFLIVGLLYPNPRTDSCRLIAILLIVLSIMPIAFMILLDMYKCWKENDMINIIRHSTVVGPFLGGFFKMLMMYYNRVITKEILDEISRDHEMFNDFSPEYKKIARAWIRNSQVYSERLWFVTVFFCVMTFPAMAIVLNLYNFILKSEPQKYMIHDLRQPFSEEEKRFESPYFETMFVYSFYSAIMYVVNFTGYDGFFGLAINHACLKMDLYCTAMEDAFKGDERDCYKKVVNVIKEQCRLFDYVAAIQTVFNLWLGIIFIATMIQICTCLYHITEGYGFDLRYMIFVIGATIHIYLPCRYAAKLKALSLETADRIYCSGWEQVNDLSVKKLIPFMIARAQKPIQIHAFNILTFDMELFVSIMQTSYSMFTLLRS